MYEWLMRKETIAVEDIPVIEEYVAKKFKMPLDVKRRYTALTEFYCLAAFDNERSSILHLAIDEMPSLSLIEEVLLHFKTVKILFHNGKPFEIMIQNVRPSSITTIVSSSINPVIESLFGRQAREIDEFWYPQRGVFEVQATHLEKYEDAEFTKLLTQLRKFNTTSIVMNTLLNDKRRNSIAFRYLSHACDTLRVTVNENNHIVLLTFD